VCVCVGASRQIGVLGAGCGRSDSELIPHPATVKVTGNCGMVLVKQKNNACLPTAELRPARSRRRPRRKRRITGRGDAAWCRSSSFSFSALHQIDFFFRRRDDPRSASSVCFPRRDLSAFESSSCIFILFHSPLCFPSSLSPHHHHHHHHQCPYFSDFMSNFGSLPLLMFHSG